MVVGLDGTVQVGDPCACACEPPEPTSPCCDNPLSRIAPGKAFLVNDDPAFRIGGTVRFRSTIDSASSLFNGGGANAFGTIAGSEFFGVGFPNQFWDATATVTPANRCFQLGRRDQNEVPPPNLTSGFQVLSETVEIQVEPALKRLRIDVDLIMVTHPEDLV